MPYKNYEDRLAAARRYANSDYGKEVRRAWATSEAGRAYGRKKNKNESSRLRRERYECKAVRKAYRRAWNWRSRKASRSKYSIEQCVIILRDLGGYAS